MVTILHGSPEPWCQLFHGDGNGDGYGYGNGYGNGDGNGDGDGDGDDTPLYWLSSLDKFKIPNGTILAYWCSTKKGTPANGGNGTKAKVGLVEEIKGPLKICTSRALHGTLHPPKWKGDRLWVVAMYPPFQFEDDKIGSLKREFIAEITKG